MSNWVKFSDRIPSEDDANADGVVFIQHGGGVKSVAYVDNAEHYEDGWFWLEGVPPVPKPRTLEEVVRELLRYIERGGVSSSDWCNDLIKEMKEILEGGNNE